MEEIKNNPARSEENTSPAAPAQESVQTQLEKTQTIDLGQAPQEAAPAAEPEVYTVVKGDTLGGIARKYYGRASAWTRIQAANKDVLRGKDKTQIRPGMKLQIPRP